MRICHVYQPEVGGVPQSVSGLARWQVANGATVDLVCPRRPEGVDAIVGHIAWQSVRSPFRGVLRERRRLRYILRHGHYDIVHLHSSKAGLVGRTISVPSSTQLIFQPRAWSFSALRGGMHALAKAWEAVGSRRCDAVIACSSEEAAKGPRAARRKTHVVYNGVDTEMFSPVADDSARRSIRSSLALDPTAFVAVCVARLSLQKGQDELVRAWPVGRDAPLLVLVGDVQDRHVASVVETAIADGKAIKLAGSADRDRVVAFYRAADVAVLPSRWEGMSRSMLEAMAAGVPVLSTPVEGSFEALLDQRFGEPGGEVLSTPLAIANRVCELAADPDMVRTRGQHARQRADFHFSIDASSRAVHAVYEDLLARPLVSSALEPQRAVQ